MKRYIAKNFPVKLLNLFEKYYNIQLNAFENIFFNNYIADLPQMKILPSMVERETKINPGFLKKMNFIDFTKVSSAKIDEIYNFLSDYFSKK